MTNPAVDITKLFVKVRYRRFLYELDPIVHHERIVSYSSTSGWPKLEVVIEVDRFVASFAWRPLEEVGRGELDGAVSLLTGLQLLDELQCDS